MLCQYRFISSNKGSILMGDVDSGGGCTHVMAASMWEIFLPSFQFCWEPKIALKNEVYKKEGFTRSCFFSMNFYRL